MEKKFTLDSLGVLDNEGLQNKKFVTAHDVGYTTAALTTRSGLSDLTNFNKRFYLPATPDKFKDQYDLVWPYYKHEHQTNTTINMMVDFVCHDIVYEGDLEDIKIVKAIYENARMKDKIRAILIYYFSVSNAFPFRMKPKGTFNSIIDDKEIKIPNYQWLILNPSKVQIDGKDPINLKYTYGSGQTLSSTNTEEKQMMTENTTIDSERLEHIYWNKLDTELYATPFLLKAVPSLKQRELLMESDFATLIGYIQSITHVKIGDADHIPPQSAIDNMRALLRQQQTSSILVTDGTVNIDSIVPGIDILDPKKYEEVNRQIETAFGISRHIISGDVGNVSVQWINIVRLVETLEHAREEIEKFLNKTNQILRLELNKKSAYNIKEDVTISLDKLKLRSEMRLRDILLNLYDRGVISASTLLGAADLDFSTEMNRKALEKFGEVSYQGNSIKISELVVPPSLPFQGQQDQGGRPSDVNTEQKDVRIQDSPEKDNQEPDDKSENSLFSRIRISLRNSNNPKATAKKLMSELQKSGVTTQENVVAFINEIDDRKLSIDAITELICFKYTFI